MNKQKQSSEETLRGGAVPLGLQVKIYDVSQQYELRRASREMGAATVPGNIAGVS